MSLDIWLTHTADLGGKEPHTFYLYDANFTHNVTNMWDAAGIYQALYCSDGKLAQDILPALKLGLKDMTENPDKYEAMNSPNGWGTYKHALPWLEKLVAACREFPITYVRISK